MSNQNVFIDQLQEAVKNSISPPKVWPVRLEVDTETHIDHRVEPLAYCYLRAFLRKSNAKYEFTDRIKTSLLPLSGMKIFIASDIIEYCCNPESRTATLATAITDTLAYKNFECYLNTARHELEDIDWSTITTLDTLKRLEFSFWVAEKSGGDVVGEINEIGLADILSDEELNDIWTEATKVKTWRDRPPLL